MSLNACFTLIIFRLKNYLVLFICLSYELLFLITLNWTKSCSSAINLYKFRVRVVLFLRNSFFLLSKTQKKTIISRRLIKVKISLHYVKQRILISVLKIKHLIKIYVNFEPSFWNKTVINDWMQIFKLVKTFQLNCRDLKFFI